MDVSKPLVVKHLNDRSIDVFTGNGWDQWSRFDVSFQKGKLFLRLVKGSPMPNETFKQLYNQISS